MIGRLALLALLASSSPVWAAAPPLQGVAALPGGAPKVAATLAATPGKAHATILDIAMTRLGSAKPITAYDVELSKRLHVIAVSEDFGVFLHEHGERPDKAGHFRIAMTFPRPGLYHVYADGTPSGLDQQVMRFDLPVAVAASAAAPAPVAATGLESADGAYAVRFDSLDLTSGREAELALQILRNGAPASDLRPFLGVAAHAVFLNVADLTYVHAHAAPAHSMPPGAMPAGDAMEDMPGMGAALPPDAPVPPALTLHVTAPKPGAYRLWIQFDAGGTIRTAPFAVTVK